MGNAEKFFNARNVAVVGAAREEWKVGHTIFKNLLACKYIRVFPVNPNASEILGQKAYRDILEIPHELDLIILAVKAELVPDILVQAGKKKVRAAIVVSAGFSEAGNLALEQEVKNICQKEGIALLGPNVFGFVNPYKEMNTTFFQGIPEKGKIAFLSQSGAIGVAVLDIAMKEKIGFSGFVSLGNSAMTDFSDFIDYFSQDKNTDVIAIYMESLREGRGKRFIEACLKCKKKIIAIKSGKSRRGSEAAQSHTASLASESGVYESVFRQAGVIEVESISELLSVADLIVKHKKLGKRACIVTNAGGLGVLCTDACEKNGIEIAKLPSGVLENLNKLLPVGWSRNNPIDLIGDALAERYEKVLKLLEKESWFDFFIVILTPQYMTQALETAELLLDLKKPVIACFMGGEKIEKAAGFLKGKVPVFDDVAELGKAVGKIVR